MGNTKPAVVVSVRKEAVAKEERTFLSKQRKLVKRILEKKLKEPKEKIRRDRGLEI